MGARGVTGTRRGNRESWVPDEPNARGYFEAFVTMGTKPDGQPDRRHVERKSKAARNKAVRELERKRDAGQATKPGRIRTVREMLTRHLDVVLPQRGRAPKTIIGYRSLCEHQIFPRWGGQRIDRLLPEYIEDGYAEMLAAGLAASTIVKVHAILSSAYEIEVRRENVARNPCRLVEPPRLPQADKSGLSIAQARGVLASVEKRRAGGGTSGRARSGARRSGRLAAGTSASPPMRKGCASWAAPGTRPSARSGRVAAWCSARPRSTAARWFRCPGRSCGNSGRTARSRTASGSPQRTSGRTPASSSPRRTAGRSTRAPTGRNGRTSSPPRASRTRARTQCGTRPPRSGSTRGPRWPSSRSCSGTPISG